MILPSSCLLEVSDVPKCRRQIINFKPFSGFFFDFVPVNMFFFFKLQEFFKTFSPLRIKETILPQDM